MSHKAVSDITTINIFFIFKVSNWFRKFTNILSRYILFLEAVMCRSFFKVPVSGQDFGVTIK